MSQEANKRLVQIFYERLWGRWDTNIVPALLSPSIKFKGALGDETTGHAGVIAYVERIKEIFPNFQCQVEELIAEEDVVAAHVGFRGTHKGELFGVAPTGKRVSYTGAAMFRFTQGRISEVQVWADISSLRSQIGADD